MAVPTNAYIVHIPGDPRRERNVASLTAVLRRAGVENVEVMPGVQPSDKGPMYSPGEWGCFLSHLACLRAAAKRPTGDVTLVFEDDAVLDGPLEALTRLFTLAADRPWDFLMLGFGGDASYRMWDPEVLGADLIRIRKEIYGTFAYAVRSDRLDECCDFLEALAQRSPLEGGGIGIDGAFCQMHWEDPTLVRLAPPRSLFQPVPGIKSMLRPDTLAGRLRHIGAVSLSSATARLRRRLRRG